MVSRASTRTSAEPYRSEGIFCTGTGYQKGCSAENVEVVEHCGVRRGGPGARSFQTPTDAAVVAAIQEFHRRDLAMMLKSHVDALIGEWRGTFQPSNIDAWFASFTAFIVHYARLAQTNNVEMLCSGTEFVQLSGSANRARWTAVIRAIRSVYRGPLAYAANATFGGDKFTSVSFGIK